MPIFKVTENGSVNHWVLAKSKKQALFRVQRAIEESEGLDEIETLEIKKLGPEEILSLHGDTIPIKHTVEEWECIYEGIVADFNQRTASKFALYLGCSEY
jgi:hypothetical protein